MSVPGTLVLPRPPKTRRARLRWTVADSLTITKRNLSHIRQVPEQLIDVTLQPIMLVLLFAYVFAGAIHIPGGDYREYLVPGIFVQSIFFTAGSTAVNVSLDMTRGINDRFLSLPMVRSAVLLGRTVSDLFESALSLVIMAVCGLIVGWRVHTTLGSALAGFAMLLVLAYAVSWVSTYVGLVTRGPEAATGVTMAVLLPLTFVANTFVPTEGMPALVRPIAEWNPISAAAAAARYLFGNPSVVPQGQLAWPLQHPVIATFVWCGVLLVVFASLAIHRFHNAAAR
ncbi:ABC transporter permease [Sphaerisporangium perillae]|uniref:ABC transporter permease n=1 Tax=Sphaerisporangium perillae TaxID=2935860 RepID=UPI0020101888|nr:ABC transporter permease [Sphaerisporangium perillae]